MSHEESPYRRLNYFQGRVLKAGDFRESDKYFLSKMRLHLRSFHSPGVVPGEGGELRVVPSQNGKGVEVEPGYAIDGNGNDLILRKKKFVRVGVRELPSTVYIVLRYAEEPTGYWKSENRGYGGYLRIQEKVALESAVEAPGPEDNAVELARIYFDAPDIEIQSAQDPLHPGPGEIDTRFVRRAGVSGTSIPSEGLHSLLAVTRVGRCSFDAIGETFGRDSSEIRSAFVMLEMLVLSNQVTDLREAVRLLHLVTELQQEFVQKLQGREMFRASDEQWIEILKKFEAARTSFLSLLEAGSEPGIGPFLDSLNEESEAVSLLTRIAGSRTATEQTEREQSGVEETPPIPEEGTREVVRGDLEIMGREFPPSKLSFSGYNFELTDWIDFDDSDSETAHKFEIGDEIEKCRKRKSCKYPDGTRLQATGWVHLGGYSEWTVRNCTPGRALLLVKRVDASEGATATKVLVNGNVVGDWEVPSGDPRQPWLNSVFEIPGSAVTGPEVTIRHVTVGDERPANLYGLWFFSANE